MADKPTPSGPSAAQLALVKKYLANAGWSESDLEELFAPETGTSRITEIPDSEAKAIQDRYQPKTQQGYAAGGLIALLADEAASGRGFYDSGISDIISDAISKGEGLNPDIKDAAGYKKIYEDFVAEQIATQSALNDANLKYAPIESRKGLPSRDERYSLVAPDGTLDTAAVDYFFPSMNKNLAAYKAKNPTEMYDLPLANRPDAPMSTTGIKPAALIKTLETALQGELDAGGSVMVNGTRVNAFDVRTLLDSLVKSQKSPVYVGKPNTPESGSAVYSVEEAQRNFDEMNRRYGPTGRTPRKDVVEKARSALLLAKQGVAALDNPFGVEAEKKNLNLDSSNFAAMKAILDKNPAAWVKAAMGGPVTAVPQKMLSQRGGQGQENINPTYQWQNALAIEEAKKRLAASGRTPFMDVLFNMAKSGAANKSTK